MLPVFLFGLQAGIFVYAKVILKAPADPGGRSYAPIPLTPAVLGTSIDLRGESSPPALPSAPQLSPGELKQVSAKSFLVYDQTAGGRVLAQQDPDAKLSIASLTKLMTGLLAYENLDFNQPLLIDTDGLTKIAPAVNFAPGDSVKAGDIFNAMIVGSCNDAAQILAKAVGQKTGEDIVDLMNKKARAVGMVNTAFSNPVGFDSVDNYSTAADLRALITETQKFAVFTNLGKTSELEFKGALGNGYRVRATNELIKNHPEIQAVKTGFTPGAQGAMATKIVQNGHDIIILVLGSTNRERDTLTLENLVVNRLAW